ncbi:helix-turn-helix transcriptional regulator, partial [Clostridiaceae bacterium UIB06]|nr:helix-turn-helix transcriptional regulator [Clostridiaceae bacterium UIB06]
MKPDPMINDIASLIAEPSRCIMLMSLLGGQRTAGELAKTAGIKPQTATFHLSKMVSAGIIEKYAYGRYRYFKLFNEDIAKLLELLMKLSKSPKISSLNQSIHSQALRNARLCYDHIAGKLGVKLTEALLKSNYIELENDIFYITELGYKKFIELGIIKNRLKDIKSLNGAKCYDWSEKEYHIAGKLGYIIATGLIELCWIKKSLISRELEITEVGRVH